MKAFIKDSSKRILQSVFRLPIVFIFYVFALTLRSAVRGIAPPNGSILAACDRVVAFIMRGICGPVLLALPADVSYCRSGTMLAKA